MLPFYHQVAMYSTLKNFFLKKEEEDRGGGEDELALRVGGDFSLPL